MAESAEHISCMEVWGGNEPTEHAISLAGLDAWVYSRPYGESASGGDVYYVSSCATGRIARLLVADVSGHGAGVAGVAQSLRTLMRKYVNHLHQTRFVQSMNEQFVKIAQNGCFATALVTTFFGPTGELSICNAGHPPPLHYSARKKRWAVLEEADEPGSPHVGHNVPLGILDLVDYEQFGVNLDIGDLVLVYTDSLIEARDASGALLGKEGLLGVINSVNVDPPEKLIPALIDRIASRSPGKPWDDDVTAMLFRSTGTGQKVTLKNRVMAPLRVLRSLCAASIPGAGPGALPDLSIANIGGAMFDSLSFWRRKRSSRENA